MKRASIHFVVLSLALTLGCQAQSQLSSPAARPVLFRSHFLGSAQLAGNTNGAKIREIWALPATADLREQVLQKLAATCQQTLTQEGADTAKLFRPLLEDFITAESFVEAQRTGAALDFVAALKLSDARAGMWITNLTKAMAAAKAPGPRDLKGEGFRGWEWTKKSAPTAFRVARAGQWLVVGGGPGQAKLHAEVVQRVVQSGRASSSTGAHWLEADVDTSLIRNWVPFQGKLQTPMAHVTVTAKGEDVITQARFQYAQPLGWSAEPWSIPTNAIRDPIISFTASRGIAPLLGALQGISELDLKPVPTQMYSWGYGGFPYSTHLAFPAAGPTNVIKKNVSRVPNMLRAQLGKQPQGNFIYQTNSGTLFWGSLPVISPALRPLRDGGREYVGVSFFPPRPSTNRAPAELFAQAVTKNNLAFYGWEITQERVTNWRQFYQMTDILAERQMQPQNAPTFKWLIAIAPRLGNSATEITVSAPNELSLLRKSHLGLTGFELVTLTRWIDSPNFPYTFDSPPARELRRPPPKK